MMEKTLRHCYKGHLQAVALACPQLNMWVKFDFVLVKSINYIVKCSVSEGSDEDEDSGEDDHSGFSSDEGSTAMASNGPGPVSALLSAVRFASTSNAENLEYFGWGEAVQSNKSRCVELMATKLMPTSSPIVHLAVSFTLLYLGFCFSYLTKSVEAVFLSSCISLMYHYSGACHHVTSTPCLVA